MAEFDPDKLGERLEKLNREQLVTMEKFAEELLAEMTEGKPVPKRSDHTRLSLPAEIVKERASSER